MPTSGMVQRAKLDLSHGTVGPFIDGGLAYRHLSVNLDDHTGQAFLGVSNLNNAGVAIGGGAQFKVLRIRVGPEIRYTHRGQTAFSNAAVTNNNNQIDLLWVSRSSWRPSRYRQ